MGKVEPDDGVCHLSFEEAGWPCNEYRPGPDGKCLTPRTGKKRKTCGHLRKCHDAVPKDEPWKQD